MNDLIDDISTHQPDEPQTNKPRRIRNSAISGWHDYFRSYLDSFAKYGVLSPAVLGAITGHTPSTVRTALHDMSRSSLVQFHRTSGHFMYYLTPGGMVMTEYKRFARSPQSAFGTVRHDMTVNQIVTNAILHSNPPQRGVLRWLGPIQAREELTAFYGFEKTARSEQLNYIPDAYLEFYHTDPNPQLYRTALEVDMGTESVNRVLHKMEVGVRALTLKFDGTRYGLLWVFIDQPVRFKQVSSLFRDRFAQLQDELPRDRMPRLLTVHMESSKLQSFILPNAAAIMELGANGIGKSVDPASLTDFVGVSQVYDRINKCKALRTQIPALL